MIQSEIEAEVRRILTEPYARLIPSTTITALTLEGVFDLGYALVGAAPEYFVSRKSLQGKNGVGYIFEIPSDSHSIIKVWDMDDNALAVTAAADNGAGLVRLTLDTTAHGWETDDTVTVHDVVGTTEANGTWLITDIDDTHIDLQGSTYASAWTSGGYAFKETDEFELIRRQTSADVRTDDETRYSLREDDLIVDDLEFSNDLLVIYYSVPDALADIPTRFHFGLPSYVAMRLIRIPPQDNTNFETLRTAFSVAKGTWQRCYALAEAFAPIAESHNISESRKVRRWI